MTKGKIKIRFRYVIPPIVTLLIYCIILAVKGIYPFGAKTIDYYDMAQQIAAFYYHVYDAIHGTKGMFYDWYTALGTNMAMSTSGCSNLSPFNLFFLFIRRDALLKSLSVFNGIKLMCMSFTMFFYLERTHKDSPLFVKLAASVGYAFCGFVLVLYITNQWVDIAVLFPLIMYFYDKLIKTGKIKGYVITLTITLIASYYLGFMILIFIFLYTGLKLFEGYLFNAEEIALLPLKEETDEAAEDEGKSKKKGIKNRLTLKRARTHKVRKFPELHLFRLGIGTLLSLALSSFILVPQLKQMLSSARFKNGNETGGGLLSRYAAILSHVKGDYTTRWWTLLGLSFLAALILTGIIRCRKDKRAVFMSVSMILMMVLELFFESINLIWHFGSYIQYPIRNGFIIYFVFAYWGCYFAAKIYGAEEDSGYPIRFYPGFIATIILYLAFIAWYRNHPGLALRNVFHVTSGIMAATFVFYLILLNIEELKKPLHLIRRKRVEEEEKSDAERRSRERYKWAAGIIVCELLCFGSLLFGKPDFITGYAEEPEQNGDYIYICDQLAEAFDLEPGYLYRMKNPDESLNANYGLVLRQPALSNWTHMIAPGEQEAAAKWGYSVQFTRLLDAGGTVFSDALLGVRRVISCVPMDERLYKAVDTADIITDKATGETAEYTLYETKYKLPFGVPVNADDDLEISEDTYILTLHNGVYHAMMRAAGLDDPDDDIAYGYLVSEVPSKPSDKFGSALAETSTDGNKKEVYVKLDISGENAIYLSGSGGDMEYANCTIEIMKDTDASGEGEAYIPVPTIGDAGNIYYPAHFNNNTVYLGCFKDEKVTVRVTMDLETGEPFDVDVTGISLDSMDRICGLYEGVPDEYITAGGRTLGFKWPSEDGVDPDGIKSKKPGDTSMLLPVTYDKGWKVKVSGKKLKASPYAGLFTRIPLYDGAINEVKMKFTPPGMVFGTIITIVSLMIVAAYIIIGRVKKTDKLGELDAKAAPGLTKAYAVAACAVVVGMYIIPIISGIILLFRG